MSFRWPNKDPDETLDYSVDWSRFLGSATISAVVWAVKSTSYTTQTTLTAGQPLTPASSSAVTDSIQNVSQTNTPSGAATVATINVAGGTANEEYTFFCTITDSTGSTAQRSVKLRVRER